MNKNTCNIYAAHAHICSSIIFDRNTIENGMNGVGVNVLSIDYMIPVIHIFIKIKASYTVNHICMSSSDMEKWFLEN